MCESNFTFTYTITCKDLWVLKFRLWYLRIAEVNMVATLFVGLNKTFCLIMLHMYETNKIQLL
jgi:hypothetical protein